jgi:hypothetical protein
MVPLDGGVGANDCTTAGFATGTGTAALLLLLLLCWYHLCRHGCGYHVLRLVHGVLAEF